MRVQSWPPIMIGEAELVIETTVEPGEPVPVHVVDVEGDELDGTEHVPSLPPLAQSSMFGRQLSPGRPSSGAR